MHKNYDKIIRAKQVEQDRFNKMKMIDMKKAQGAYKESKFTA